MKREDLKKTKAWNEFEVSVEIEKDIADSMINDTIKKTKEDKVINVHSVGKIEIGKYESITSGIRTDEVIITDERIEHIIERRGKEFYEKYGNEFGNIVSDPDYIFKDSKLNTALACKRFLEDEKYVNVALRIAVSTDKPEYKNSIITAVGESDKRFAQRLRNNSPIYKKE